MNADGSNQQNLTKDLEEAWEAIWSPDGKSILYLSERPPKMYIMNTDGSNKRRLTNNRVGLERYATWSPVRLPLTH